jgi:hypothetical protein
MIKLVEFYMGLERLLSERRPSLDYSFELENERGFIRYWFDKGENHVAAQTVDQKTMILARWSHRVEECFGVLQEIPILFDRSRNLHKDVIFFADLIKAFLADGGIFITLDHRDNYFPSGEAILDEGAHYALINTTRMIRGIPHFKRNAHGVIPLPIFTRLMGRGWVESEVGDEIISDPVRWGLVEVVEFLDSIFPGRVCLAEGAFYRLDTRIRNAGLVSGLSSYRAERSVFWEEPLCQRGLDPQNTEGLIRAFNDPGEIMVVRADGIYLVDLRTEAEKLITTGALVGELSSQGSNWIRGLTHPKAPAYRLYDRIA